MSLRTRATPQSDVSVAPAPAVEKKADPSGGKGNTAVADIVKANNRPTGPRELDPKKRGIVHFGLNGGAKSEAMALHKANRDDGGALSIRNQKLVDGVRVGKKVYDLSTPEAAAEFTSTLGISDEQAIKAAKFLGQSDPTGGIAGAKDELAQLVKVLAEADTGERELKRLVLSGHSAGDSLWGDGNGEVKLKQLEELVKIFPNARKSIEHLLLSACSSGGELAHTGYREMFPNLESSTGYLGSSPGTYSGALKHIKKWEKTTEKGKPASGVDPTFGGKTRKAENMSTWNKTDGYKARSPGKNDVYESDNFAQNRGAAYDAGEVDLNRRENHDELRAQYDRSRRLAQNSEVGPVEREYSSDQADYYLRLLHYDDVKGKYMEKNGAVLADGYAKLGRKMPDFSKLSRKDAVIKMDELEAELPKAADGVNLDYDKFTDEQNKVFDVWAQLTNDLRFLNKDAIPNSFI